MIDLSNEKILDGYRTSSKGNQLKWVVNDLWIKADSNGYEGLSEYVVSQLLKKSSLKSEEFVEYSIETIRYGNMVYNGCVSKNFLKNGQRLITLQRLNELIFTTSLTMELEEYTSYKDKIRFLVNRVIEMTELFDFGDYLYKILLIDALFLNEDRHLHNIALICDKENHFSYCPIFDQGAALLSDTRNAYPLNMSTDQLVNSVKARTVGPSFDMALSAAEELYGDTLTFSFTENDVNQVVDSVKEYSKEEKERVKAILKKQMKKYEFFF